MNLKTTFVLLAVVAGAAAVWWLTPALPSWVGLTPPAPDAVGAGTQDVLKDKIVAAELSRIEIAPRGSDRLATPTWLHLDTRPEVVRLAPGLVGALSRPADYYLQPRLFPFERVAKGDEGPDKQEKVEQLDAKAVAVEDKKPAEPSKPADE